MIKRKVIVSEDFYILARAVYEAGLRQKGEQFRYTNLAEHLAADIEAHCPMDPDESRAAEIFLDGLWLGYDWPEYHVELSSVSADAWFAAAAKDGCSTISAT